MNVKLLITSLFLLLTSVTFSQKISVSEINEKRSTSENSFYNECEIELKIWGDEIRKYKFVKISKITKAIDDQGLDLINEDRTNSDYIKIDQTAKIKLETKVPSRKAKTIKELSGEVSLYNPNVANGSEIKIANYQSKTNVNLVPGKSDIQILYLTKESYAKYVKENKDKKAEELKKLPEAARQLAEGLVGAFDGLFSSDETDDSNKVYFYVNGDKAKFVDLFFEDATGKKIERNGSMSNNNLFTYYFDEKPNTNWKLVINIETDKSTKKVLFKLMDIELP
ncbi:MULTISPECIES: hypothetical protein [unclassified Flavobacterium]|uniref:hypothetical protein n=1 Tax=unclassified Flavobacterium TaxID=196869 RepID=UPI0012A7ED4D|nr:MULTISPECIES: hypothetical protein [unclassified Flavobacterium]MBF4484744.1 hypothetical protein [Flavobacterium sp. CSZ]QGK75706.1 hypothetical protein GIY83_17005 [Flavobacterium sp. SLB02]